MNYYPDSKFVVSPDGDIEEEEFTSEDKERLYKIRLDEWEQKHGSKPKPKSKPESEIVVSPDGTARKRELPRTFESNWGVAQKIAGGGMRISKKIEDVEQNNWDKKDLKEEIDKARKDAESAYKKENKFIL